MFSKQQQQRAHAKADALTKVADISTPTHFAFDLNDQPPQEAPSSPCVLLRPTALNTPTILVQVVRMRERERKKESARASERGLFKEFKEFSFFAVITS